MKIKCPRCGAINPRKKGNHKYIESGLDNVYLENIPVYECSCGVSLPSIFRLSRLHELIALNLLQKLSLLGGNEIRFLRKNLRLSSKVFADTLGVGKTTISKWENEAQKHSEGYDRLIRTVFMIAKGVGRSEQQRIEKQLRSFALKKSKSEYTIIAERVGDDYVIRYMPMVEKYSPKICIMNATVNQRSFASRSSLFEVEINAGPQNTYIQRPLLDIETNSFFVPEGIKIYGTQTA
jgi:putative zinc finger/helix-turn-helix YgiT family protein